MNDADILANEYRQRARQADALRKRGICPHTWTQGNPHAPNGPRDCLDCGKHFESHKAWFDEYHDLMA